jgi:hypothetical protein
MSCEISARQWDRRMRARGTVSFRWSKPDLLIQAFKITSNLQDSTLVAILRLTKTLLHLNRLHLRPLDIMTCNQPQFQLHVLCQDQQWLPLSLMLIITLLCLPCLDVPPNHIDHIIPHNLHLHSCLIMLVTYHPPRHQYILSLWSSLNVKFKQASVNYGKRIQASLTHYQHLALIYAAS